MRSEFSMICLLPIFGFMVNLTGYSYTAVAQSNSGEITAPETPKPLPEPPPKTSVKLGKVGGTAVPGIPKTPHNPSQTTIPAGPGIVVTIPIK